MRSNVQKKAFTLVELLVVLAIFSVISAMSFHGMITLSKGIKKPRDMSIARKELGVFVNGLYRFINNSYSTYLVDAAATTSTGEFYYLNPLTPLDGDIRQDILYLVKDDNGTAGRVVFNDTDHRFEYYKDSSTSAQIMLEQVYRMDAAWSDDGTVSSSGVEPIFQFPHQDFLYDQVSYEKPRPKTVIIQFRKIVATGGSEFAKPVSVPMTLMIEVNVSTFEAV